MPHATGLAYIGKGGGHGPSCTPPLEHIWVLIRYPKLFFLFQNRDIEYFEIILKCVWWEDEFSEACFILFKLNFFVAILSFIPIIKHPEAEFKEFERRFKFKPRLKYGWFHLKLYQMFQDLSRRFI